MYIFSIVVIGLKNIKKKWPEYRCNPLVMPFAGQLGFDATTNFVHCVSQMQSQSMNFFLQPIHYMMSLMGGIGNKLSESMNFARRMQGWVRGKVGNLIGDIFGVFLNILIQIQRMIIKLKDMAMKIIGTMATILYIMSSSMKLGQSIWAGPIGGVLRTLCFKEDTQIKLESGELCKLKNINLGDKLCNGAIVIGTLKLQGSKHNPFYKIWSQELKDYIYVTGEHKILNTYENELNGQDGQDGQDGRHIQDAKTKENDIFNNYIKVSSYNKAEKTDMHDDTLYCLITSNHRIPVGEFLFWDWED